MQTRETYARSAALPDFAFRHDGPLGHERSKAWCTAATVWPVESGHTLLSMSSQARRMQDPIRVL